MEIVLTYHELPILTDTLYYRHVAIMWTVFNSVFILIDWKKAQFIGYEFREVYYKILLRN